LCEQNLTAKHFGPDFGLVTYEYKSDAFNKEEFIEITPSFCK